MRMTKEMVQADLDALIRRYVKNNADVSALRGDVLTEQQFHRIYFYVTLDQIGSVNEPDKICRWTGGWRTME